MLVTEGSEHQTLMKIFKTKDEINQKIGKSNEVKNMLYKDCPRLVPPEFNPQCVETFIDIASTSELATKKTKAKKAKQDNKKKTKPPKQVKFFLINRFAFFKTAKAVSVLPKLKKKQRVGVRQFFKPIEIEIDAEIDEHFDLSSYRGNNTSTEHQENTMEDQFQIESSDSFYNKNEDVDNAVVERTMNNFHDDEVPLTLKFEKVYDLYHTTKKSQAKWNGFSEKLSKTAYNKERLPECLRDFLATCSSESNENRVFKINRDPWHSYSDAKRVEIFKFMSLFTKQNNLNASKTKSSLCESANLIEDSEAEIHTNNLIDSQLSFSMQMEDHQSKYASQLKAPAEPNVTTTTPLQQIASSTPHKLPNLKGISLPIHSPIVNIPVANNSNQNHQRHRIRRRDVDGPDWYLKFLGLNTVFDLFLDDDDNRFENITHTTTNTSDEKQAKLCDTLNKSVCGNENLVEEESQYTVSRILKICEDAEKKETEKPIGSARRRRRLYIGSVDDLFREDDDNVDDDDADVIINTQAVDVTLSESDDTVNYDVEDAMANHNDLHHSASLFKDITVGEPSNKSSNTLAKSVMGAKSDELFSTYHESLANISKHDESTVNSEHQTRSQHEQSIQKTPTKKNNLNSNLYIYHSRSPSMLIKSSSVLSTRFDNNQDDQSPCDTSKISKNRHNKSPTTLSSKLSVLNTQLSFSKYSDDFDDTKENFSSPFFTVRSPDVNRNQNRELKPEDDSNCETEYSGDDIFTTCQTPSVFKNYFHILCIFL